MQKRDKIYIDGAWVPSTGKGTIDVVNSTTEEVMGTIPDGTPADVDKAVKAAKAAFATWSQTSVEERGKYLQRITEGLQGRMGDIAQTVAQEVGMPLNLSTMIQAEIIDEVGLPAGVFNLVSGTGPVVGEAIAAHPDVDMVSFTGSTRAGKRVSELASQTVKRVALELGGKSPNVILDDADLEKAVSAGVGAAFLNSGQTCSALTRMLVPRSKLAEAEQIAVKTAESYTVGDPFADGTRLGPLVSAPQRERVRGYIKKGIDEGAKLLTGGAEAPEGLDKGYFVKPTVFSGVSNEMTIAQEEIFGPVLSIIPYDDEDDAVRIANDTIYGLAAGVWSGDPERAKAVARRIRSGQVEVNGGAFNPMAPFGGFKQSGHGRELGQFAIEEFLTTKSLQL